MSKRGKAGLGCSSEKRKLEQPKWGDILANHYKGQLYELLTKINDFKNVCISLDDLDDEACKLVVREVVSALDSVFGEIETDGEETNGLFSVVRGKFLLAVRCQFQRDFSALNAVSGMRDALDVWLKEASTNGEEE